jgi:hypothetical protein
MNWVVAVVGLGGLAVTALGLILNYRERTAGLRGPLYTEQVKSYRLVLAALADLHGHAITPTSGGPYPLDGATRVKLRATATDQVAALAQTFTENVVFLPRSVADSVAEYRGVFAAITASAEVKDMYPPQLYDSADPQADLTRAFARVWQAMRHQLGTERLSEQTVKLVGASLQAEEDG